MCLLCGHTKFVTPRSESEQAVPQCVLNFPWGAVILEEDETLTIGRDPEYSSVASELTHHLDISRRHGSFSYVNGSLVVHDAGSRNGTYVNGEPVDDQFPAVLQDSGTVILGKSVEVGVDLTG